MGFFTKDTKEDALKQLEKINQEMRAISASMHLNYNMIDGSNREKVRAHYNNIVKYYSKYKDIKRGFSIYDQLDLERMSMSLWNGKPGDVTAWEFYFNITIEQLYRDINY